VRYLIIAFMLSACSYQPVVDLRASGGKAEYYQRDLNECRQIIKDSRRWFVIPGEPIDRTMVNKCLTGRGHSVLSHS
jgi:hypothetical protein